MQNVDDPINQLIRRRIRNIRRSKKITVRQAALMCNIPESSYSCLENGFYRISLLNLNKMLSGLGVAIEDVWPRQQQKWRGEAAQAGGLDLSYFRFQEIFFLSESQQAALLRGFRGLECLHAIGMSEDEKSDLVETIQAGLKRNWTIFPNRAKGVQVYLCLLQPILPDHVKRLISIYLDLWLAVGMTESVQR